MRATSKGVGKFFSDNIKFTKPKNIYTDKKALKYPTYNREYMYKTSPPIESAPAVNNNTSLRRYPTFSEQSNWSQDPSHGR